MSHSEIKHKHPNPNKLKPLPRLVLALAVAALGACQKPAPPITASVPGTETVLTFVPTDNGVRVYEFSADQPNKIMTGFNVGDVVNAYEEVNNIDLNPLEAAGCADAIAKNNPVNLQPEPADSKGPSSAREVLAPEGGLTILTDICGDLNNSTPPTASSASTTPTQTSTPVATLQTPIEKALINNENIVAVLGTLCVSILGIGAVLFGGLRTLGGKKKPKEDKPKSNTQVVLTRIEEGDESQVPTVISLSGDDNIPGMIINNGKLVPVLRDQVAIVMETDPKTLREARRLLTKKLVRERAPAHNRAEIASLAAHEADHIEASPDGVSKLEIVKTPSGMIIGASVTPLKPDLTAAEIRTIAKAPENGMSEQDRYVHDHAEELARERKKK